VPLTGVHFLLTYRCTLQCDHCFVRSSPAARGTFTLAQVERVLTEAERIGTVTRVYFEGGEPFLYHGLLVAAVLAAGNRGFETGVVTNGYFSESVEDAVLYLEPLARLGLADLSVSADTFHCREGDERLPENTVRAAERLGIPVGTISIEPPDRADHVVFRGRAADHLTEGLPRKPWRSFTECPDEDLVSPRRVHVDSDGNVHVCQGISMGNLWKTPLSEIIESWDARKHPICGPLVEGGPARLAEVYGVDPEESGYVSACHLCYQVRRALRQRFPEHLAPAALYEED
jgi:MoaA/NifB/PqqE/SkfB family radical SAM enzyme